MASLRLSGIEKSYGDGHQVVQGVDVAIQDGEFAVLVGPSGCGKSTVLRMIAGLEEISAGDLYIGDQRVNDVAPSERGVAMVFQSYALYPHMTVAENMGFSLKLAGKAKREIHDAVGRAAEILQISQLLDRRPKALSGGQRQRVAIGRAIVRKPRVFLFDEPLSNLDAGLRVQMRIELSKLHQNLGTTMVYVTHDQVEAMTLGDRILVMNGGRIEQAGAPLELYQKPSNIFVAGFLGSPKMNFLPCRLLGRDSSRAVIAFQDGQQWTARHQLRGIQDGSELTFGVRPEHLRIVAPAGGLRGRIDLLEHLGDSVIVYLTLPGASHPVAVKLAGHPVSLATGDLVGLGAAPEDCYLFGADGKTLD
jgi:multiple sugar transport system ATP-binding protein